MEWRGLSRRHTARLRRVCYSLCYSKRAAEGDTSRRRRKRQRCDQHRSGPSGPEREPKDSYKDRVGVSSSSAAHPSRSGYPPRLVSSAASIALLLAICVRLLRWRSKVKFRPLLGCVVRRVRSWDTSRSRSLFCSRPVRRATAPTGTNGDPEHDKSVAQVVLRWLIQP